MKYETLVRGLATVGSTRRIETAISNHRDCHMYQIWRYE
jgi:hypothetical protein